METPSSTRRITRSQTQSQSALHNSNNVSLSRKIEDSEKGLSKSKQRNGNQQDRSALIDITNDSPIVGLAMYSLQTPSSSTTKQRSVQAKKTPGSGEALLRDQVKTLLQKVEEEAEFSKLSIKNSPFHHLQSSPAAGLLAPTPANTPQIENLSSAGSVNTNNGLTEMAPSPDVEEQLIHQVVSDIGNENKQEGSLESQKSIITRSLLLDFSEKSEVYDISECSSDLTYEGREEEITESKEKQSRFDDDASVWSIQVNASSTSIQDEDEEDCYEEDGDFDYDNEEIEREEHEEDSEGLNIDELCECISKISVNEQKIIPKYEGKHTRFVYNSDDEIVEEESEEGASSPNVMCLKGLPTPKGKHLRFLEEE